LNLSIAANDLGKKNARMAMPAVAHRTFPASQPV